MTTMVDNTMEQMQSIIEDPQAVRRFAGIDSMSSNSTIPDMVRDDLSRLGLNAWPEKNRKALERVVLFRLRERFDEAFSHTKASVRNELDAFGSNLAGSIVRAHARALSESLVPQQRVTALRQLNWHVIAADNQEQHFILPDCVVAASSSVSGELKPFAGLGIGEAAFVIMPLSSQQLLVGSASAAQVARDDINLQLARCSLQFFICSKQDEAIKSIAESIGRCAGELKIDLFDGEDADWSDQPVPALRATKRLLVRAPVGKFGNSAKKVLSRIAEDAFESTTFDQVDSIIVPANMRAALEAIWKRTPTTSELQATAFGTVEPVKSGAEWKCRVIVPREVVEVLIQPSDPNKRLLAIRLVKHNLGRAYYFDCWARCCPAVFDSPASSLWSQITLRVVFRAASCYFGGLASARHESEPLPGGESLQELAAFLRHGLSGLREARLQFFTHRDVDRLTMEAVQSIELILVSTASVCGFLEAKNTTIARNSDAGIVLSDAGLWEWCILFAEDLRRHYEKRSRWASEVELHQLADHIERHLWTIGVIVSKTDSGHWIDVLDDERMPFMGRMLST